MPEASNFLQSKYPIGDEQDSVCSVNNASSPVLRRGADTAIAMVPGADESRAGGLHLRLKANTAVLHYQVEKTFDLKRRIATPGGYRNALLILRDIHLSVQQSLDRLDHEGVVVDRGRTRARIDWLDQDLAALGVSARSSQVSQLVLRTAAEALGCLYVIEGAALGGQHLFRIVHRRLGLDEGHGARYFFGSGDRTSAIWAAFVRRLDAQPAASASGVEHGARRTFALFDSGLDTAVPT